MVPLPSAAAQYMLTIWHSSSDLQAMLEIFFSFSVKLRYKLNAKKSAMYTSLR